MRGLKLTQSLLSLLCEVASFTDAWIETKKEGEVASLNIVASFTDAWIETPQQGIAPLVGLSHLLQMRGLKHFCLDREHHRHESHLLQMRGLKHTKDADNQIRYVASFTDAWIETSVETRFTDTR